MGKWVGFLLCLFCLAFHATFAEAQPGEEAPYEGIALPQAPPPPTPPPPPPPPMVVPPPKLEELRIAGSREILPDPIDRRDMHDSGKTKVVATYKLCIDRAGSVTQVNMLKSSGFPAYDVKVQREMRTWRYRPYLREGVANPVCTSVTFIVKVEGLPPLPPNLPPREAPSPPVEPLPPTEVRPSLGRFPKIEKVSVMYARLVGDELLTGPTGRAIKIQQQNSDELLLRLPEDGELRQKQYQVWLPARDGRDSELNLWVSAKKLAPVLLVPVLLGKSPAEAGASVFEETPGIRIDRGQRIKVLKRQAKALQIEYAAERKLSFRGWVAADAVANFFLQENDPELSNDRHRTAPGDVRLRDRPGGAELVRLRPAYRGAVTHGYELERKANHVLFLVRHPGWSALGWIPAGEVTANEEHEFDPDALEGDVGDDEPNALHLEEGTKLLDRPSGTAIGEVRRAHRATSFQSVKGHQRIRLWYPFGAIDVWVAPQPSQR